jgi:hypothetical protein
MLAKKRGPRFRDVSTPGWWWFVDEKGKNDDAWTLVFAAGVWWRTCALIPNSEALVVETDKEELDRWYGESARRVRAWILWGIASQSQQALWTAKCSEDPFVEVDAEAASDEKRVVDALYQAIEKAGSGDRLDLRMFRAQAYPIRLLRKSNREWGLNRYKTSRASEISNPLRSGKGRP